jgi:hypothetical protein
MKSYLLQYSIVVWACIFRRGAYINVNYCKGARMACVRLVLCSTPM